VFHSRQLVSLTGTITAVKTLCISLFICSSAFLYVRWLMVMFIHLLHGYNLINNQMGMYSFHFCLSVPFRAPLPSLTVLEVNAQSSGLQTTGRQVNSATTNRRHVWSTGWQRAYAKIRIPGIFAHLRIMHAIAFFSESQTVKCTIITRHTVQYRLVIKD